MGNVLEILPSENVTTAPNIQVTRQYFECDLRNNEILMYCIKLCNVIYFYCL